MAPTVTKLLTCTPRTTGNLDVTFFLTGTLTYSAVSCGCGRGSGKLKSSVPKTDPLILKKSLLDVTYTPIP